MDRGTTRKQFDPMATARSAVANASREPATSQHILDILRTGAGHASHVRALFSDLALTTLMKIAIEHGISDEELARAYLNAKGDYAASNAELEEFVRSLPLDLGA